MVDHIGNHAIRRAMMALALALLLAGCVQASGTTSGYGSTLPSGPTDPYHYRCTGNCQAG